MSHNDDFIGQLEDYLEAFDGVTPLPDRVRDAIRAELPSARQVRPRPGLERVSTMLSNASAVARLGLAAAAIVVAVVLGARLPQQPVRGDRRGRGPRRPRRPRSLRPSSRPRLRPRLRASRHCHHRSRQRPTSPCAPADTGKSCLAPGTYQLSGGRGDWPVTVTIDVPAGWFEWGAGAGWDAVLVADPPDLRRLRLGGHVHDGGRRIPRPMRRRRRARSPPPRSTPPRSWRPRSRHGRGSRPPRPSRSPSTATAG